MSDVLETYFNPTAMRLAYRRIQCWPDRLAKDQVGIRAFGDQLEENCDRLSQKLIRGGFVPSRGFKYYMPKASKTNRTRTVLAVEDALVYQAIANCIAERQYDRLAEYSSFVFGSVLSPQVKKGVALLDAEEPDFFFFKFWKGLFQKFKESVLHSIQVDKMTYRFETDITGFFDCIPHYNMLEVLSSSFGVEDEVLDLLSECFNRWSGTKESYTPGVGIPQGPLPSYLLANLLLHDLDKAIVEKGLSYYRYMDDISIYGYNEAKMLESLVMIDNYLKSNGLSLNAKKTSIERIDASVSAEKEKALQKLRTFSLYAPDDGFENLGGEVEPPSTVVDSKFSELGEQDHAGMHWDESVVETLVEMEDVLAFWQNEIEAVAEELPKLFENPADSWTDLVAKEEASDTDFIALSARFGLATRKLEELGEAPKPKKGILKFWMWAFDSFFWRVNNFSWTLGLYRSYDPLKAFLKAELKGKFKLYEWSRYFTVQTLSMSQSFSDQELRTDFFPLLNSEDSELVRIAVYRLLLMHTTNAQFVASVDAKLKGESSDFLKLVVLEFKRNQRLGSFRAEDFLGEGL